jgi:hypothetical protein
MQTGKSHRSEIDIGCVSEQASELRVVISCGRNCWVRIGCIHAVTICKDAGLAVMPKFQRTDPACFPD